MIEGFRFLAGERQNFLHARGIRNVADDFCFWPGANLFLDLHPHGLEIESHFLENIDRDALAELDQSQQKMLGADVIVIETISLFASKLENLLSAGSEIIHCSVGVGSEPSPASFTSLLISGLGSTFKRVRIIWARRWSRSSAFNFCCDIFCRCAGCVSMNNSSIGNRLSSGKAPRSTPSLMIDNKLSASLELIACAYVSTPYARPIWSQSVFDFF